MLASRKAWGFDKLRNSEQAAFADHVSGIPAKVESPWRDRQANISDEGL